MNKLLIILTLCFTFILAGCANQEEKTDTLSLIHKRGKLIVGVKFDTKPFGYFNEKHELVGFDVDLAKTIAKSVLGSEDKVEFVQVTPSSRILALDTNQVDMVIATLSITPQREKMIDFSMPYYIAGQAILVPKNSKISSISDLNGKKVIIIYGSTAENNIRLIAPEAQIIGFRNYLSGYSAIKQGMADAMVADDTILMGMAESDDNMKFLPKRYTKEPYAVGFKKSPESTRLEKKVDFVIKTMLQNGDIARLKAKWVKY